MAAGLIAIIAVTPRPVLAADALWIAKQQTIATQISAFARVEPRARLRLNAGIAGTLRDLAVQPGDEVTAGAVLGHLTGPSVDSLLATRQAALASAEASLSAAQQELTIEREKAASRLSTREAVDKAAAALTGAQSKRDSARAQLSAAEEMAELRAPQPGRVLALGAADGERVAEGETILTLLPDSSLWLRAAVYGADAGALRSGMPGEFVPAAGGGAIPVKLRAVLGALNRDGGRTVYLVASGDAPHWLDGEAGTVTIDAGSATGVAVPTRALILDQARWWVLVHTDAGDQPQPVTPGPSRGALTLIESGLSPGAAVVVANAYLEFHRGIGEHYQPPD